MTSLTHKYPESMMFWYQTSLCYVSTCILIYVYKSGLYGTTCNFPYHLFHDIEEI